MSLSISKAEKDSLVQVVNYLERDEEKHYMEGTYMDVLFGPAHIYLHVLRIKGLLSRLDNSDQF